jgi:hypothetical protein
MTDKMTITLEWGETKTDVTWDKAKAWCESLGNGWRMPMKGELLLAYEYKIGGFCGDYWSSTEDSLSGAWIICFSDGYQYAASYDHVKVRAVREVQG